jgi:hypothetical protein
METSCIKEWLVGSVRGHGPLQALIAFQPFVTDTREQRSHRRDLIHDFRRVPIFPAGTEPVCDVLDDDPVRPAPFDRIEHLIEPLDAALGTGERTFLFEARAGGQNHIGKTAGLAEKHILHHEKIELFECVGNVVDVRVHQAHLFAVYVHGPQVTLVDGVDHVMVVQALR